MTRAQRSYRIVQITRRLMLAEGVDPSTNDVAEFYHSRADIQGRVLAALDSPRFLKNFQDFK